jgi:hypothetical protein
MNDKWQEWEDLDDEYNEDIHSRKNKRKTRPAKKKKSYNELQEKKQKNEQVNKKHPTRS